jgi:signal transduction histidine kinase
VTDANVAAGRLLGITVGDDLIDRLSPHFLSGLPACPDGWPPAMARLPGCTELREHELQVDSPAGPIEVSLTARFHREGGVLRDAVISCRDLRPRRRLEQSSAEVVSTVSHELRAPLASVKGYTATLLHRWDRFKDED